VSRGETARGTPHVGCNGLHTMQAKHCWRRHLHRGKACPAPTRRIHAGVLALMQRVRHPRGLPEGKRGRRLQPGRKRGSALQGGCVGSADSEQRWTSVAKKVPSQCCAEPRGLSLRRGLLASARLETVLGAALCCSSWSAGNCVQRQMSLTPVQRRGELETVPEVEHTPHVVKEALQGPGQGAGGLRCRQHHLHQACRWVNAGRSAFSYDAVNVSHPPSTRTRYEYMQKHLPAHTAQPTLMREPRRERPRSVPSRRAAGTAKVSAAAEVPRIPPFLVRSVPV
jgi:hypothetical protein